MAEQVEIRRGDSVASLVEELAGSATDTSLTLPAERPVPEGEWVRFSLQLADGTHVMEGVGQCRGSMPRGNPIDHHDVVLVELQFDERNEIMWERLLIAAEAARSGDETGSMRLGDGSIEAIEAKAQRAQSSGAKTEARRSVPPPVPTKIKDAEDAKDAPRRSNPPPVAATARSSQPPPATKARPSNPPPASASARASKPPPGKKTRRSKPPATKARPSKPPPASASARASKPPPAPASARASKPPPEPASTRASNPPPPAASTRASKPPPPAASTRASNPPPPAASTRASKPPPAPAAEPSKPPPASASTRASKPPPAPAAEPSKPPPASASARASKPPPAPTRASKSPPAPGSSPGSKSAPLPEAAEPYAFEVPPSLQGRARRLAARLSPGGQASPDTAAEHAVLVLALRMGLAALEAERE